MNPERVAVFIDNSNAYRRLTEMRKAHPEWVVAYDPLHLARRLAGARTLSGTYFYCTPPPSFMLDDPERKRKHDAQMRYFAAVQRLEGVNLRFGELKGAGDEMQEKNLDTQITADMITMAAQNRFDTAILVSNDSDFESALTPTKEVFGKKIELLYFPGRISNSLIRLADVPRKARKGFFQLLEFGE